MATDSKKEILKTIRERRYLNKDFDSLRSDLIDYARTYYPDAIKDFSEAGLGGLLVDFAATVGDVQSFYLDHQFQENFSDTSEETNNIQRHLERAGVPIEGAAPAVVTQTFMFTIPASGSSPVVPDINALPILYEGTVARANNGTEFQLTENLDFTKTLQDGSLEANIVVGRRDANNNPLNFIVSKNGICISGFIATENFSIGNFTQFKKITLSNENVTEIIRIVDSLGNEYYEVDYLTQDTVYKRTTNYNSDSDLVPELLTPIPAPYRFIKRTSLETRLTTLTFGGGSADSLNDDIIPDPSEFALPLYGKRTFSRFNINPGNLLQTTTLGVLAANTTLTVTYRYGGGLSHNVEPRTIRNVTKINIGFPNNPSTAVAASVRNSLDCVNVDRSSGGDDAPSIEELKLKIPEFSATQGRIVSNSDFLARIYTLPSNFGRVFRASVLPNPNNPLATQLYIICRNADQQLITAPDSLKINLVKYLNSYRLISDAVDILDARIINLRVNFSIVADPRENRQLVLRNVLSKLKKYFNIKNYDIGQPIVIGDIQNIIFNTQGVVSVVSLEVKNVFGFTDNLEYSSEQFDVNANTNKGIIFGPAGSIFEVKYKDYDLIGTLV